MRRFLIAALLLVLTATSALALHFPALTGRVVDDAHILSPQTQAQLTSALANYEAQSTNQIVVVTLPSLEGTTIEDYGYQLGRAWGIGQKGKDNGALLIVAPSERKVRIEVGYGLEGTLTDAVSHQIIQTIILPQFRAGHMEQGVVAGTNAIIGVLGGTMKLPPQSAERDSAAAGNLIAFIIFLILFVAARSSPMGTAALLGASMLSSGRGFSSGGGGFSGGGGSFGGGGASGGW